MNNLKFLGALVAQSIGMTGSDGLDGLLHNARAEIDEDMDAKQYETWLEIGCPTFRVEIEEDGQ